MIQLLLGLLLIALAGICAIAGADAAMEEREDADREWFI